MNENDEINEVSNKENNNTPNLVSVSNRGESIENKIIISNNLDVKRNYVEENQTFDKNINQNPAGENISNEKFNKKNQTSDNIENQENYNDNENAFDNAENYSENFDSKNKKTSSDNNSYTNTKNENFNNSNITNSNNREKENETNTDKIQEDEKILNNNENKNNAVLIPDNNKEIKIENKEELKPSDNIINYQIPANKKNSNNVTPSQPNSSDNLKENFKIEAVNNINQNKEAALCENEQNDIISNLDRKIMGKNFEETKDQFSDPENIVHIKINEMIDHNIQVDGDKIEEEYKEEHENNQFEEQISVIDLQAKYSDDWNMGAFELIINHCFNCHKHKTTTRHYEFVIFYFLIFKHYVEKFNELGNMVKETFPNLNILGNYDKIDHLGCFDVYIRGVGPKLDDNGRFYLFSKKLAKRFPTKNEILDKLITLSILYGSSCNMESAQAQYIKAYTSYLPKQNPLMHEHPTTLSEEGEKEKAIQAPQDEKKIVKYFLDFFS